MNYIKHLSGFFEKIKFEDQINPSVISVYLAIFQIWNHNRFKSPIHASREEIMLASKISSTATYHKCIKILEEKEFINYTPSYSSYTRTEIEIIPLENVLNPSKKGVQKLNNSISKNEKPIDQPTNQPPEQPLELLYSIYNNKHIKTLNKHCKQSNVFAFDQSSEPKNEQEIQSSKTTNRIKKQTAQNQTPGLFPELEILNEDKPNRSRNPESKNIPPNWDRVFEYFIAKSSTRLEAEKFYNYFQSNGWLVGGKTKMKDWHAAARNWMLNSQNYKTTQNGNLKPNHLNTNQDKNYAEPL
ncbi:transcriptional regulator [Flavobacterium columnare]|uniref:Transcriptional regulator n=1 Tax=Flavobacterium columnare TaxID=996 RepID=A0A437UD41_9FLAO|nr:transcriptional regulator [Flavobacterium columnare]RVU91557.1 transcriptional regulator [Flavobacterium columnare]